MRQKKMIALVVATLLLATAAGAQTKQTRTSDMASIIRTETMQDLRENILPFWMEKTVNPDGGFYGAVTNEGEVRADAPRGAVLNARILWTFARAYRQLGLERYREMADRAADYLVSHFVDRKHGGVYWTLDGEGRPLDTTKQTYACAFAIYGLAEHFRATGDQRSLEMARKLYETLEEKVHDKVRQGYIESFRRDYSRAQIKGVDGQVGSTKTMNTHIHLLEAYTTLYQVWPDSSLKANLKELLGILGTKLYSKEREHLILFCDDNWNAIGETDSYGHDIETSWLMSEAAAVVGDAELKRQVDAQAVKMARTALKKGLNAEGAMRYEKTAQGMSTKMSWWPQCETIIGAVNAWQLSGEQWFLEAALRNWNYVKQHFIDRSHGGWLKELTADGKRKNGLKVSEWDCPYHNSRLGFEMAERLAPVAVHTEVMAWSNMTGVRQEGELIDFESTLRVGTPGTKMEKTGREKQQRIRYTREGSTQKTVTPMHGAEFTQTVTDVDMLTVNLSWKVEAKETLDEGAYVCFSFAPKNYGAAKVRVAGKKVTVKAPEREVSLCFDQQVKAFVREEDGEKVVYVTLLPVLRKGATRSLSAVMTVNGTKHHETAEIRIDTAQTGRQFAGFGGNFRIQNVQKDPTVIDYCLRNMRVAFGRVEMPWALWDKEGAGNAHVKRSAEMARRLKQVGMPVIVSCWFPPQWAGEQTTRSDGTARAYALKAAEKDKIYASLASYLLFLKQHYGVEADYFSFNESDLGIDVVFTPQEHCDFIKNFGQYLADKGLKTRLLLGDNSDATTFDFILPALNDASAHKYIGAISFHSWRGCDDATLKKWAAASRQINVPLIVGEGSTDAAAHQYPAIFNETTFALYEINLYTRLCALCQPLSILQWQLTSDYSILWGDGIYRSEGPLRPTQRFFNLKQLSMTPKDAFATTASCNKENVNVAAFVKTATGATAVHIVNNGAACEARVTGLPAATTAATVYVTNQQQHAEAQLLKVEEGTLVVKMPAESFVSIMATSR
ncbi:MAG: AGE family epimerase/isomerase [Prevotella sp.]|nr:AGE family epimerase/isomerase [Prevotella sp.]